MRLARRDWERARRVPDELAAELAGAGAEGQQTVAGGAGRGRLRGCSRRRCERNVTLAREYGACVADDGPGAYEGLLGDYDFGLRAEELRGLFGALAEGLPPLVQEAERCSPLRSLEVPVAAQQGAVEGTLARLGVDGRAGAWTSPRTPSRPGSDGATRASRPATATATSSRC